MKISEELLYSLLKGHSNQPIAHVLSRATHLRLNSKNIDKIEHFEKCNSLLVLYLYENRISKIENLHPLANLTHLYLQHNRIRSLENLAPLKKLMKLYLDGNYISRLSGLESLRSLEELHVSRQILAPDEEFTMDEESFDGISGCLRVFTASENRLIRIEPIERLLSLQKLDLSNNLIQDIRAVKAILRSCRDIRELDLSGNPITHQPRYVYQMMISARALESLDGRDIPEQQRQAIASLEAKKNSARGKNPNLSSLDPSLDSFRDPAAIDVRGTSPRRS
eukprot:TRINITY_DN7685_c0_g1_i3.p1 TRINITY_DN7685_c0_g1~~TRINITY_DN7685_c0_g1_i3.p1  ORF type:complete len:280 (+),score=55.84 TRINITY_DN7685_c0_g1_i3:112-951(+)